MGKRKKRGQRVVAGRWVVRNRRDVGMGQSPRAPHWEGCLGKHRMRRSYVCVGEWAGATHSQLM